MNDEANELNLRCPKDRKFNLVCSTLTDGLTVQSCPDCKGTWIPAQNYQTWRNQQGSPSADPMPKTLDVDYVQSPLDNRAALCPECGRYLSRAKVSMKSPFYVERCMSCQGIWCDHGEWEVLAKMGLHTSIDVLFSSEWQAKMRERELAELERQAMIEKLGSELAEKIFELATLLTEHPNGDFGVAYLMRRFDQ